MEVAEAGGEAITDTGSLLKNGKASKAKELGNHWRKCFFNFMSIFIIYYKHVFSDFKFLDTILNEKILEIIYHKNCK